MHSIFFLCVKLLKTNIGSWKKGRKKSRFVFNCLLCWYVSSLFILYFLRLLLTSSLVMTWNESEAKCGGIAVGHVTTVSVERRHTISPYGTEWGWSELEYGMWSKPIVSKHLYNSLLLARFEIQIHVILDYRVKNLTKADDFYFFLSCLIFHNSIG